MSETNEDMAAMLQELKRKGFKAGQLKTVGTQWGIACDEGAHPDLAAAARAEPGLRVGDPGRAQPPIPAPPTPET